MRINLFLAKTTRMSRRKAENLIREGRVRLNGKILDNLGTTIHPWEDVVELDGVRLVWEEEDTTIIAFHKPAGYLTSHSDRFHNQTIFTILPQEYYYFKFIGRLDLHSRGLLLLTNSGSLLQRISHPNYGMEKEYHVTIPQPIDASWVHSSFTLGIWEGGEFLKAKEVIPKNGLTSKFQIILTEGKKRQIRRMFQVLGYPVVDLIRVRIGNLKLKDLNLKEGEWKKVSIDSIVADFKNKIHEKGNTI